MWYRVDKEYESYDDDLGEYGIYLGHNYGSYELFYFPSGNNFLHGMTVNSFKVFPAKENNWFMKNGNMIPIE